MTDNLDFMYLCNRQARALALHRTNPTLKSERLVENTQRALQWALIQDVPDTPDTSNTLDI